MKLSYTVGLAAAAAMLVIHSASAQTPGMAIPLNQDEAKSPEQIEKQKQIDADYKATLKKIPDAKANDPWGNMRSADTGTPAKPTQLKPKSSTPKKTSNAGN
jgi:hypothetical protein